MAPRYELIYFDIAGLAEPIRYILSYGKIEFVDTRLSKEEFLGIKEGTPFGKVPLLKVDDKVLHQSITICRYLARQLNLTGKDDYEAAQADAIVDTLGDMRSAIQKAQGNADELKQILQFYLAKFEKAIQNNNGYFVGGHITWADIYFVSMIDHFRKHLPTGLLEQNFPGIKNLEEKVTSSAGIKAWIEKKK